MMVFVIVSDVGIGLMRVDDVIVVFKSFLMRVGVGLFLIEMFQEEVERFGFVEYGIVIGRRRRVGWFDFEFVCYFVRINGVMMFVFMMFDKYDGEVFGVIDYDKFLKRVKEFVEEIEERVGVLVGLIKIGLELEYVIDRRENIQGRNFRILFLIFFFLSFEIFLREQFFLSQQMNLQLMQQFKNCFLKRVYYELKNGFRGFFFCIFFKNLVFRSFLFFLYYLNYFFFFRCQGFLMIMFLICWVNFFVYSRNICLFLSCFMFFFFKSQ